MTLLRPEITTDDDGVVTAFAVLQEAPAEHPVLRPHRLAIGGYDLVERDGATHLERTVRVELDVDGERTEVPDLVGRPRPALVLVNDDDLAYAKIRLDAGVPRGRDRAPGRVRRTRCRGPWCGRPRGT